MFAFGLLIHCHNHWCWPYIGRFQVVFINILVAYKKKGMICSSIWTMFWFFSFDFTTSDTVCYKLLKNVEITSVFLWIFLSSVQQYPVMQKSEIHVKLEPDIWCMFLSTKKSCMFVTIANNCAFSKSFCTLSNNHNNTSLHLLMLHRPYFPHPSPLEYSMNRQQNQQDKLHSMLSSTIHWMSGTPQVWRLSFHWSQVHGSSLSNHLHLCHLKPFPGMAPHTTGKKCEWKLWTTTQDM